MDDKYAATIKGINDAFDGTPEGVKLVAMGFIELYAAQHQFFTGGDILAAFRVSGLPHTGDDWRNRWGALVSWGHRRGLYAKAGRVTPTTRQSHTGSLVQWQSRVYLGEQALAGTTAKDQLEAIRKKMILHKIDLRTALWQAYEVGISQKDEA